MWSFILGKGRSWGGGGGGEKEEKKEDEEKGEERKGGGEKRGRREKEKEVNREELLRGREPRAFGDVIAVYTDVIDKNECQNVPSSLFRFAHKLQ